MKTLKLIITVSLILSEFILFSQDTVYIERIIKVKADKEAYVSPFQITFVTPLGTNGIEAGKYTNKFSLNILAGYSGGLDGVEFGGISNVINGKMKGVQFAGIANVVNGEAKGVQFSGFSNIVRHDLKGGQFAGFSNIAVNDAKGIQAAGFSNVTKGNMETAQIAGFSNIVNNETKGGQFAGFTNITRKTIDGIQIAGFANVAGDGGKAFQIAGFSNLTKDTLSGIQISGFINIAKHIKGSQIGVINICDTMENGIPLGVISIVKKGYHKLEIGVSESFYAQASIKLGVQKFYNILSIGFTPGKDMFWWGPGYGIGSEFILNEKYNLNIDALSYFVFDSEHNWIEESWEEGNWDYEYSSLNKISLTLSRNFGKFFTIYGGPSFNITVSNETTNNGTLVGTNLAPWNLYTRTYRNTLIEMYPGFNLGIRLF